jgi:tryptophanyl-tRNA synthetase
VFSGKSIEQLEAEYEGKQYGHLKVDLAEIMENFLTDFQSKVNVYLDDPAQLDKILAVGAAKARDIAQETVSRVYSKVGLLQPSAEA